MTSPSDESDPPPSNADKAGFRPLRIWPPLFLMAGMVLFRYLPNLIEDGPSMMWMFPAFGIMLCGLGILLWWLFASHATKRERWLGLAGIVAAIGTTIAFVHPSMRGPATTMLTIPMATAGFALGTLLLFKRLTFQRTVVGMILAFLGAGFSTLLRNDGMWGNFSPTYAWRWTPSSEDRLARRTAFPLDLSSPADPQLFEKLNVPEWPGFRGPKRDGIHTGPPIHTDWQARPPTLLWKIAVGPAWSSFAVAGDLLFTQEQRGNQETVFCYEAGTGNEVWQYAIEGRFDDPLGGPGPRATPTLNGDGLYVMTAQGWVARLNPRTGAEVWKQDLREVASRKPPMWGFCSSPLVIDSLVIVYAGGDGDKGTLAFDKESGNLRWSSPAGKQSYASPHLVTILGENLIALSTDLGLDLLEPTTGKVRLAYEWKHKGYRSVQPIMIGEDSAIIPTGLGTGTRRIRFSKNGDNLTAEEMWTSRRLKPDYNDCVLYQGNLYGFDDSIFTCINAETGERQWKAGRYGKGQVLLLEKSGVLLIASERGEL
ncbi:MAG: PQQ-binding-like beta-propeller repeat protein, partial [Verrucomicrobiota bacterium]